MPTPVNEDKRKLRGELKRQIGMRVKQARLNLPPKESSLGVFAKKILLSESQLSKIESGNASLPLELLEVIATATGCRREQILTGEGYPQRTKRSLDPALLFLQQAKLVGVEGLHAERAPALTELVEFASNMRAGRISITGSSLRGLEQRSEHDFVKLLQRFANDRPKVELRVIMTHPKHGSVREHLEHRPKGSITREIFAGISWCLEVLHIDVANIRLHNASPCCFSIFLEDGPEGCGLINPYPAMRQSFMSFALVVRRVAETGVGGGAMSVFQTYRQANFEDPWQDQRVTTSLPDGMTECADCIKNKTEGYEELHPHEASLQAIIEHCRARAEDTGENRSSAHEGTRSLAEEDS